MRFAARGAASNRHPSVILLCLATALATTSCGLPLPWELTPPEQRQSENAGARVTGGADTGQQGNFRNGAQTLWTLDAEDIVAGGTWEMPHDNPTTGLAFGPIAAGGSWLVNVNAEAGSVLVGLDPTDGEVLWQLPDTGWEDCVVAPDQQQFLCAFTDGRVAFVDAASGQQQEIITTQAGVETFVEATDQGAVVVEADGLALTVHGLAPDGTERYTTHVPLDDELIYDYRPLHVIGDQVEVSGHEGTLVLDFESGEELGRFSASLPLTGSGAVVAREGVTIYSHAAGLEVIELPATQDALVLDNRGDGVAVVSGPGGLSVCEPTALETCSHVDGTEETWDPTARPRLERVDGRLFVVHEGGEGARSVVIDVESATLLGTLSDSEGWSAVAGAEALMPAVVDQVNWSTGWQENPRMRHPLTGTTLGVVSHSVIGVGADVAPGYSVFGWTPTLDPSSVSGWAPPRYLSALVGGEQPRELDLSGAREAKGAPAEAGQCPEGTFLLAYASFPNGSITVCGIHVDEPTVMIYRHDGKQTTTSGAAFDGVYTYSGALPEGGALRLAFDLGVYEVTDQADDIVAQGRTDLIWYVMFGKNRPTTGQFDVPLPDATAEGQVGYLAALLASSKAARSSLVTANTSLQDCAKGPTGNYSDEITAIDAVTTNRAALLAAFESAPVDLVPEGQLLLNELRTSIRHSLDADIAFASWARGIQREGCAGQGSQAGLLASERATAAKKVFVAHWNSVIAPQFPVGELVFTDV